MLEKTLRLSYLLDFYQTLLTPKQREYMNMYYFEDLSLVEISELAHVSRQAIYDNIKRTENILESYEENLRLYEKYEERNKLLDDMYVQMKAKNFTQCERMIEEIKALG
ncbi:MAG TPA: putative DNA-binding protein [Bacillota bacterium]|nr:putative DNA-binding protein [Bacillota bacterium]